MQMFISYSLYSYCLTNRIITNNSATNNNARQLTASNAMVLIELNFIIETWQKIYQTMKYVNNSCGIFFFRVHLPDRAD
jgi:hypothetical protein